MATRMGRCCCIVTVVLYCGSLLTEGTIDFGWISEEIDNRKDKFRGSHLQGVVELMEIEGIVYVDKKDSRYVRSYRWR